jgi:hypothetical protein
MPGGLEEQMLEILNARRDGSAPITIGDFARMFGASPALISQCAQRLVDEGTATPFRIDRRGVAVLQGLRKFSTEA